jgi:hypothetical protein
MIDAIDYVSLMYHSFALQFLAVNRYFLSPWLAESVANREVMIRTRVISLRGSKPGYQCDAVDHVLRGLRITEIRITDHMY